VTPKKTKKKGGHGSKKHTIHRKDMQRERIHKGKNREQGSIIKNKKYY
jgi:hypothetical protein